MLSTVIEQRRRVTAHLVYEWLLGVLGVVGLGFLFVSLDRLMLEYLDDSSRTSVQEAALEVARPVIHQVASDGAPPASQTWGLHTIGHSPLKPRPTPSSTNRSRSRRAPMARCIRAGRDAAPAQSSSSRLPTVAGVSPPPTSRSPAD
jgi:hypothetical protein